MPQNRSAGVAVVTCRTYLIVADLWRRPDSGAAVLVEELVQRKVEVIVATSTPAASCRYARHVHHSNRYRARRDPVGSGLVVKIWRIPAEM